MNFQVQNMIQFLTWTDNHVKLWFTENLRVIPKIEQILEEVPVNAADCTVNNHGHQYTQQET